MLSLTDIESWKQLDSVSGNAEGASALIEQCLKTPSKDLFDDLYDYIFHQQSLYQATFAMFPYLVKICQETDMNLRCPKDDENLRVFFVLLLGVTLLDVQGKNQPENKFADSNLDKNIIDDIIASYYKSVEQYKEILYSLTDFIKGEEYKRYFIAASAAVNQIFHVGKVFSTYSSNDEYICCCPKCETEYYLENEDNKKLIMFAEDPVFCKNARPYAITPRLTAVKPTKEIKSGHEFEWLSYYIETLEIESLKSIINYLFGEVTCPHCKTKFGIFEAIS